MRRILVLLGALALAGALALPAQAGKPVHANGTFAFDSQPAIACNVEQWTVRLLGSWNAGDPCPGETVVNNPTGCTWSRDDSWSRLGSGNIPRGAVVTGSVCDVADGTTVTGRKVDAEVLAGHGLLVVRLDTSDGRSWPMLPVRVQGGYRYVACTYNNPDVTYPEIAGSNGGHGTPITYTLTIDATARGAHDARALIDDGIGAWSVPGCP